MKLLVDNALSHVVARRLTTAGHDAIHVRDIGLASASDDQILEHAAQEARTIISADTDFATILALRQKAKPSFILLRGDIERHPDAQATMLEQQLPALESHLNEGAVVVITRDRIRIRRLPIVSG